MAMSCKKESQRFRLQRALDAVKTQAERNRLGQFSTPFPLAVDIIRTAKPFLKDVQEISFLDPAFGTGVFFSALCSEFPKDQIKSAVGIEVDDHYFDPTDEFWKGENLKLIKTDFTKMERMQEGGANLLVANPPYVRHHHIEKNAKQNLVNRVIRQCGIRPSGLSGLYCYFIYLSVHHLSENGISCWLVPSEFLDVNYGRGVKQLLLSSEIELLRIHRYSADDVQFEDALVSSCVLIFRKSSKHSSPGVHFTQGCSLETPEKEININREDLDPAKKWNQLFSQNYLDDKKYSQHFGADTIELGEIFEVKRGLATGSNKFFVMTPEIVRELGFSRKFFRPILPSPRDLKCLSIEMGDDEMPNIPNKLLLLDVRIPLNELKDEDPLLYDYISGAPVEVSQGYLCSKRKLWYSQERRDPSPILCTYMSRNAKGKAFRFIRNKSTAIASNSYLMLYPRRGVFPENRVLDEIHAHLCRIDSSELIAGGRVYGGGLHKLEPKELMRIRMITPMGKYRVETHEQLPLAAA